MTETGYNNELGTRVEKFYNQNPFPGYDLNKYMLKEDLYKYANPYARMLDDQIPWGKTVLDAGCGTGQLACLLSLKDRKTRGIDFSEASLQKARALKEKLKLHNVHFKHENLMELQHDGEKFDFIFCNGVLHHTGDPYRGFLKLLPYSQPGTYFVIGLYNTYGRFWHRARRKKIVRGPSQDPQKVLKDILVKNETDREKLETWYQDQYLHPFESTHTIQELLHWYQTNGIIYINSIPPIELGRKERPPIRIFEHDKPSKAWRTGSLSLFLKQLKWVVSLGKTGGYFMIVGRKQ